MQLKSNLSTRFTFVFIGLLTLFSLDREFKKRHPKIFEAWEALPISFQESWKRFWIVILGTSFFFVAVAGIEQALRPRIQTQQQFEQKQTGEECPPRLSPTGVYCLIIKSELLKLAETFSIIVAAWIFILDRQERREQAHRENWNLIDGARGSETSGARFSAIERLHQERVSLKGLDAEGADLQEIKLEGANLERANLQKADLKKAILRKIVLQEANLQEADLEKANLEESNLWLADLRGANLKNANLKGSRLGAVKLHRAVLRGAILERADLRGARFYDTDFRDANLEGANLNTAEFVRVKNLTFEQIQKARNWEKAKFAPDVFPENPDIPRWKTILSDSNQQTELIRKLCELREIENLVDEVSQRRKLSEAELDSYLKNNSFEIPAVNTLRELVLALEDIQEHKIKEIEDLTEDLRQELATRKQVIEAQKSG